MRKQENSETTLLLKKILKLTYYILIIISVCLINHIFKSLMIYNVIFKIIKILIPFYIGFVISWILKPLLDKLEILKIPKLIGALIIYGLIFLFVGIMIKYLIPSFNNCDLKAIVVSTYNSLTDFLYNVVNNHNIIKYINRYINLYINKLPSKIIIYSKDVIRYCGYLMVGLVIGLYRLINYDEINDFVFNLIPLKKRAYVKELLKKISDEAHKSVNGTIIVASLVFLTSLISFIILKVPNALIYSLICGVTDLIPYIGPYIGAIPVVITGFTISKKLGITLIIVCIIIQSLENYLYGPIILSKHTKLNPLLIIFGLLLFGGLFGIIGLIIATPIMAIIRVIINEIIIKLLINERRCY